MAKRKPEPAPPVRVGGAELPPFPAGWKRYRSELDWRRAVWAVLDAPELLAAESELRKLSEELAAHPPAGLGYWSREWLTDGGLGHAKNCLRDDLAPAKRWNGDDRPATDRKRWHPDLIAAAWERRIVPALAKARGLLALARDPDTWRRDRDPQELVDAARAAGAEEFARHVIESLHRCRFECSYHNRDRVTWHEIATGRKTVAEAWARDAELAAAARARDVEYARHSLRAYRAAAAALGVGKDTDHVGTVNRRLKAARAGRVVRNGRYPDRQRDAKTPPRKVEWFLWAECDGRGATAIVAPTVRAAIERLRVLVLSVSESQVTPEILDQLRKG